MSIFQIVNNISFVDHTLITMGCKQLFQIDEYRTEIKISECITISNIVCWNLIGFI